MPFSMKVYVHYMNLMKTKLYKNFKVFKLWRKGLQRKRIIFKNHLSKKLCSRGSKCLVWGACHMCKKKSCQKTCLVVHWNSFLNFLRIYVFRAINQNIHTQLCMNVKTHHHHMNYFKLDYLNLFQVNVICKKWPHKSPWILSPFFGTLIVNKPN